jgi:hypothetical protein
MHGLPSFDHRHNADESYDSICTKCYATVASAGKKEALSWFESAHVCDPIALCLAEQGSIPVSVPMLGLALSTVGADESRPTHNRTFPLLTKLRFTVKPGRAD